MGSKRLKDRNARLGPVLGAELSSDHCLAQASWAYEEGSKCREGEGGRWHERRGDEWHYGLGETR